MFGRLRCHFCGQRSKYAKGTTEFRCEGCEALNFFDAKGEVAEAPNHITNPASPQRKPRPTSPFESFARPSSQDNQQKEDQLFCQRCLNNQRMYVDALNSYLPDEDHPRYQEYIEKLPQKKADLEKKYPQVCKICAPKVQERIYQADYYGMSQQAAAAMNKTRARRGQSPTGQRDDWGKWTMRLLLRLVGMVVYGSLLVQAAWHLYSMASLIYDPKVEDEMDAIPFVFEPSWSDCAKQPLLLRLDLACHQLFRDAVKYSLVVSFCLIWHNHGLKDWYHHTHRTEALHGQAEHFRLQLFLLIVRAVGWYNCSTSDFTQRLSSPQKLASHGFLILFIFYGQRLSESPIRSEKWKIKGKIMPRPGEEDVFGAAAGPSDEQYLRQASSTHPLKLFARDSRPFPIDQLAPKGRGYSKLDLHGLPPPSPPDTESVSDDEGEAMEIDTPPATRTAGIPGAPIDRTFRPKSYGQSKPQMRSMYNHGTTQPSGWGAMRNEVFGMQDDLRLQDEHKRKEEEQRSKLRYEPPVDPSPFRGRLPQAPMSVGRRLRNPPTQVSFKQTPVSKQQDFMKQMRETFENGKTFGREDRRVLVPAFDGQEDEDEDFSPAKHRTRGNLDLKPASWHLPGDGQQTTGLEELLGGTGFAIADEPERVVVAPRPTQQRLAIPRSLLLLTALLFGIVAAWNVPGIRRPVLLWLVRKMEDVGV